MAKNKHTLLFGILNLTPDSFSDGAEINLDLDTSLSRALSLYMHGADVLDIGAESTRPGATKVSAKEEMERLVPFLLQFKKNISWPLSVDTRKPEVVKEVLQYQVEYINDVSGLQGDPDMAKIIGEGSDTCKVVVMHSDGKIPPIACSEVSEDHYGENGLYEHMKEFFIRSIEIAEANGIHRNRLILDPGIGFGKSVSQALDIVNFIPDLKREFKLPVLVGPSRKSFIKPLTTESNPLRLEAGTAAYNVIAVAQGADMVRVHDIKFHRDVLQVTDALCYDVCESDGPEIDLDVVKL